MTADDAARKAAIAEAARTHRRKPSAAQAAALLIDPTALDAVDEAVEAYHDATVRKASWDPATFGLAMIEQDHAHDAIRDIVAELRCTIQRLHAEINRQAGDRPDAEVRAEAAEARVADLEARLARVARAVGA